MSAGFIQALLDTDTEWHLQAACRHGDVHHLFFPTPGPSRRGHTAQAIRICRRCPVRRQCGDWAKQHHVPFGVWGGRLVDNGKPPN